MKNLVRLLKATGIQGLEIIWVFHRFCRLAIHTALVVSQRWIRVAPLYLVCLIRLGFAWFAFAWFSAPVTWAQSPSVTPPAPADSRDQNVYVGPDAPSGNLIRKFATNLVLDQKAIWTSPAHIDHSSAKWWILAGVATAGLLAADHQVSQALPFSGTSTRFGTDASRFGQWYTVVPVAGALFGSGWAFHDDKLEETGLLAAESLGDSAIVTEVTKLAARRQRPGDGDHGGHFEKGGSSFPSGHSTEAWALASVVASEYGNKKWVPVLSYTYASLISTSRILAQEHFTSDVFVGAAVGFFVGRYAVRTQQRHRQHVEGLGSQILRPAVMPSVSSQGVTVALAWSH